MTQETFTFQAEVGKLLDIVARSLYSNKEVFLRELISNASDACDKLRHAALTDKSLATGDAFRIDIAIEKEKKKKKKVLKISDNGIGMSRDELNDLLGTIARSGTRAFAEQLSGDKDADMSLIGQFGVGFYSAFMVADTVEVLTRRAGQDQAWLWISDGKGTYTIEAAERPSAGTDITLHLSAGEKEFLEPARITNVVKTYSDHVGVPVNLVSGVNGNEIETLNTGSALWTREKKDITADQYKEFYHHVAHAFDEPWMTIHNSVEGVMSYTNLLFVPSMQPFDLFNPERKSSVKLYVNRVFITDDCEELLPSWLRFMKGVIDSEDISLNISREMLQRDPALAKIRKGVVKRILGELKKKADKKPGEYASFWKNFGAVVKEGLYEDFENRDKLLDICRFRTTECDEQVSLSQYVERMKDGQESIYFITGEDAEKVTRSPQLEGFRAKGVEVLLLCDPIDDFWMNSVTEFQDKPFRSITRAGGDLDSMNDAGRKDGDKGDDDKNVSPGMDALVARMKVALGEAVKDVRPSSRLTDSAVCLVADDGDMDMNLERILKQHNQAGLAGATPRILELNPAHPLVSRLADQAGDFVKNSAGDSSDSTKNSKDANPVIDDAAHMLLDQARILEGEDPVDGPAFARRVWQMMEKGMAL